MVDETKFCMLCVFFFFQAEDGIRDVAVTGVQTCALPIFGGIAGCAIGAWLTLWMSADWPIVVGGKPVGSIPPYVVIMFEMTILFGALSTILDRKSVV